MLSRKEEKFIRSLHQKKHRQEEKAFVAEGQKLVRDLLDAGMQARLLVCSEEGASHFTRATAHGNTNVSIVNAADLKRISGMKSPNEVLAVFDFIEMPDNLPIDEGLLLFLDGIRDPGNLGTILRIADWFGLGYIYGSPDCVDLYNPKVVQASMGSIARVRFFETTLGFLKEKSQSRPVLGASMDGENIYSMEFTSPPVIVIGNEAQGIRQENKKLLDGKLSIPRFERSNSIGQVESLNAAIATAIICSEFRRKQQQ